MFTGQELAEAAMERFDLSEPHELARKLGLTAYGSPRRVKRWLEGEAEPDYSATVALLDLLGAIRWEALTPEASGGQPGAEAADLSAQLDAADAEAAQAERARTRSGSRRGAA